MTANGATAGASKADLEQLVAEADIGGRKPSGLRRQGHHGGRRGMVAVPALVRLPAALHARLRHLQRHRGALLSLELRSAPRLCQLSGVQDLAARYVPLLDWALAAAAIACVLYLVVFYRDLAQRPGLPTFADILVSVVGVVLLIEASRRAEGPWMPVISIVMLALRVPGSLSAGPARAQGLLDRRAPPRISGSPRRACSASRSASRPPSSSCSCCSALCSTRPAPATTSSRSPFRCSANFAAGPPRPLSSPPA